MLLMQLIRRALLDAYWARSVRTVAQNFTMIKEGVTHGKLLGINMYGAIGPWPVDYDHGIQTAIHVLLKTQQLGRHEATLKFSAARRARSAATYLWKSSAFSSCKGSVLRVGGK